MPDDPVVILERISQLTAQFERALSSSDWAAIEALDQDTRITLDFQSLASVLHNPSARARAIAALSGLMEVHRRALNQAIARREEIADALHQFRREREAAERYDSVLRGSD